MYVTGAVLVFCAAALSLTGFEYASTVSYIGVGIGLLANIAPGQLSLVVTVFANIELNKSGVYGCGIILCSRISR